MENKSDDRLTFGEFLLAIVLGPAMIIARHARAFWWSFRCACTAYWSYLDRHDPLLPTGIERHWKSEDEAIDELRRLAGLRSTYD